MREKELIIFCDGGARGNPGPAAAACVIKNSAGNVRVLCGKYLGRATNNEAEYAAVQLALEKVKEYFGQVEKIRFFLDSELLAKQLSGLFKIKKPALQDVFFKIRGLESVAKEITYQHILREKNKEADLLVNKVLDQHRDVLQTFEN